jgi:hypothetical protein
LTPPGGGDLKEGHHENPARIDGCQPSGTP